MIDNYLSILEDSLKKKADVLDEIAAYNSDQEQLLKNEETSMEDIDANMEKKDELIGKLEELDQGFESLYERIREQLLNNKDAYKAQIKRIQDLISAVTEKSVSIQAQEARNKKLLENYLMKERKQIGQGRQASKAAYGYYESMSNRNMLPPQFMDQKQ